MSVYEYKGICGHSFEMKRSILLPVLPTVRCPDCGTPAILKMSNTNFVMKF